MPNKVVTPPFAKPNNITIMNGLRKDSSITYQDLVPDATKANYDRTVEHLLDYQPARNEFFNGFINKVGQTIIRSALWDNPLKIF